MIKKSIVFGLMGLLLSSFSLYAEEKSPQTVAEKSAFTATSLYQDVIDFIQVLQVQSPLIKVETMGISPEGRKIPLVILGNPAPSSPADLRFDDRIVVYFQANIHAGEVEGKEAALMLMRDILQQSPPPYLDQAVILIAPIFNIDGNEKISPDNRRSQAGPINGVGVRYNGQNLDLNRDSMKMESPELQGLVKNVLLRWDPVLLVDCHTTNGSYHEEPLTYSWPLNPNGDQNIRKFMQDEMMPALRTHFKEKYNFLAIPYGNFMGREMDQWRTFSHQPRFVTNYIGLRNRLSILIENYSYAEFKTRVHANYNFLKSILDYCLSHQEKIQGLVRNADLTNIKRTSPTAETFGVEFDIKALPDPITILGYELKPNPQKNTYPRMIRTDVKKEYTVKYLTDFFPTRSVTKPFGYLIPVPVPEVAKKLKQHGITIEKLLKPVQFEVEAFHLAELKASDRLYQGHHMNTVKGEYKLETKVFPVGTLFVATAQPLSNLISYLLEPESDDGLLVWNFFDRLLASQWRRTPQVYPVYKLIKAANLVTTTETAMD